jgi:hypothetical protein
LTAGSSIKLVGSDQLAVQRNKENILGYDCRNA